MGAWDYSQSTFEGGGDLPMQFPKRSEINHPEFLSDSAEQIAESIDGTGLRDKLEQAFATAIAKVRQHRDESSELPIDETNDVDS